jgi:HlyD family secretion protein
MNLPPLPEMKRSLIALSLGVIAAAFIWALWPKAVPVDVAQAARGPLRVTVDEEGKTRIKDVYTVSAPITGKLLRVSLDPGDDVRKDETLVAIIEPAVPPFLDARTLRELEAHVAAARAGVTLAEAEVQQTQSELEFAESELVRARALSQTKTISVRAFDKARLDADMRRAALVRANANLEVRQRELESAKARLIAPEESLKGEATEDCCLKVRTPVSGRVLRLIQESEKVVVAGAPLVEIGDPASLEFVAELLSADAVKVREGATASVEGWGGTPIAARVTRVEPAGFTKVSALGIEEQRVRVILDLAGNGKVPDRLGHDFRVFVKIIVYESPDALRVPISALFRNGEQWAVFAIEDGRARTKAVEIGHRNIAFAEVLSGLPPGAVVILHPTDRIADGVRITPVAFQSR